MGLLVTAIFSHLCIRKKVPTLMFWEHHRVSIIIKIRRSWGRLGPVSIQRPSYLRMAISMLKIRRPLGRLIFNMGIAIPGKTVFLIETAPWFSIMGSIVSVMRRRLYFETVPRLTWTDSDQKGHVRLRGHCRDYYPGTLSCSQVFAIKWRSGGNPQRKYTPDFQMSCIDSILKIEQQNSSPSNDRHDDMPY